MGGGGRMKDERLALRNLAKPIQLPCFHGNYAEQVAK